MQPKRLIESMTDEELAVLQTTLPVEFERRGLAISSAVDTLTANAPELEEDTDSNATFDLKQQYGRAIDALTELGISTCQGRIAPTLDAVIASLEPRARQWLNERAQSGIEDELVIAPAIGTLRLDQLIRRFDRKQAVATYMWRDLWHKFSPTIHNQDNKGWQVAVVLNDTRQPKDKAEPINKYGEAGLAYTGQVFEDQQKALKREARKLAKQGLELKSITISQVVLLNTQRRLNNQPQLDERTFTRLVHYPAQQLGDFDWVPAVSWLRGRLRLFGSETGFGWDRFGVRRVLKLKTL